MHHFSTPSKANFPAWKSWTTPKSASLNSENEGVSPCMSWGALIFFRKTGDTFPGFSVWSIAAHSRQTDPPQVKRSISRTSEVKRNSRPNGGAKMQPFCQENDLCTIFFWGGINKNDQKCHEINWNNVCLQAVSDKYHDSCIFTPKKMGWISGMISFRGASEVGTAVVLPSEPEPTRGQARYEQI